MKVELHLHTTRYSGCAVNTPAELMERMVQMGYEAVYITEHDAVWSDWEIAQLQAGFPDIRIFPGMELSVVPEPIRHVLVLGSNDPEYLRLGSDDQVLAKARAEGHLAVLAHPFRWEGGLEMLAAGLLPDALELRSGNHNSAEEVEQAKAAAERFDLALVNSGDTHSLEFLGRFWIETDVPILHAEDIRGIILNGQYVNCVG